MEHMFLNVNLSYNMTKDYSKKELSPAYIMESLSVSRYQKYLDTGEYPDGVFSKTWDMLAWLDWFNNNK